MASYRRYQVGILLVVGSRNSDEVLQPVREVNGHNRAESQVHSKCRNRFRRYGVFNRNPALIGLAHGDAASRTHPLALIAYRTNCADQSCELRPKSIRKIVDSVLNILSCQQLVLFDKVQQGAEVRSGAQPVGRFHIKHCLEDGVNLDKARWQLSDFERQGSAQNFPELYTQVHSLSMLLSRDLRCIFCNLRCLLGGSVRDDSYDSSGDSRANTDEHSNPIGQVANIRCERTDLDCHSPSLLEPILP